MYRVIGDAQSGNCYKIKLALEQLGLEYQWTAIDILAGETRQAQFLSINPAGKIPVLMAPDETVVTESNAILFYLARGSHLWPDDHRDQTHALQWMFFEQYSHEPYIATARFIRRYLGNPPEKQAELEAKMDKGHAALAVMEQHLSQQAFLVSSGYSIADIALFAYTHVAEEGGFELARYPAVQGWIERVSTTRGHVAMG